MRLTNFSDYALRVLMFAQAAGDRLVTIEEMSEDYGISRAHLRKVVNTLTRSGFLTAVRGRSGGITLAMSPEKIILGDVVRATETDFALVECFSNHDQCAITKCCKLQDVLDEALEAFLAVLDRHTLASIAIRSRDFRTYLELAR